MEITTNGGDLVLLNVNEFDLNKTLDCGQCFRFNKNPDGSWHGVAGNRPLTLYKSDSDIVLVNTAKEEFNGFWREYFDLDRDYRSIQNAFPDNIHMQRSIDFASGMRILRQDSWEALISFIISQNNNIPRIKGIIDRLCREFGQPLGNDYGFPSPADLAGLDENALGVLRCGWRAAYILDAAQRVCSGEIKLKEVASMAIETARKTLRIIHGVGPKVADCVLLYGMARHEAFPLDIWMKRAMASLFPDLTPQSFGQYAGIAQQYIFHYCRSNPECLGQ